MKQSTYVTTSEAGDDRNVKRIPKVPFNRLACTSKKYPPRCQGVGHSVKCGRDKEAWAYTGLEDGWRTEGHGGDSEWRDQCRRWTGERSIVTGLGRKPVGYCYSVEMRRPAIRSTAHDPTLSYPTYQPGLSASYPRCQPPDFCYQLCTPKGVHNKSLLSCLWTGAYQLRFVNFQLENPCVRGYRRRVWMYIPEVMFLTLRVLRKLKISYLTFWREKEFGQRKRIN